MAKKKNSVQKLIGFENFTKYGVKTDKSEFVFFHVEPTNISVLCAGIGGVEDTSLNSSAQP